MEVRREANVAGRVDRADTAPAPTAAGEHSAPGVHDCVTLPCLRQSFSHETQ
jgi:hypothetical protein